MAKVTRRTGGGGAENNSGVEGQQGNTSLSYHCDGSGFGMETSDWARAGVARDLKCLSVPKPATNTKSARAHHKNGTPSGGPRVKFLGT